MLISYIYSIQCVDISTLEAMVTVSMLEAVRDGDHKVSAIVSTYC